jgi:hypothetical protein
MKKLVLLTLITSSFIAASGQHPHLGIKAGVNLHNLRYKDRDASDFRTGLHLGLQTHIHITRKFAIQPELFYSMQGGTQETQTFVEDARTKLDYINLPVLAQYMFGNGFRIQAGPQLGFLLSAKTQIGNFELDVKDEVKSIDISLPVGLSYVTKSGFGVDGRWAFGLTDINDRGAGAKTYNNGAQIGVFYIFGTAHKGRTKGAKR